VSMWGTLSKCVRQTLPGYFLSYCNLGGIRCRSGPPKLRSHDTLLLVRVHRCLLFNRGRRGAAEFPASLQPPAYTTGKARLVCCWMPCRRVRLGGRGSGQTKAKCEGRT